MTSSRHTRLFIRHREIQASFLPIPGAHTVKTSGERECPVEAQCTLNLCTDTGGPAKPPIDYEDATVLDHVVILNRQDPIGSFTWCSLNFDDYFIYFDSHNFLVHYS